MEGLQGKVKTNRSLDDEIAFAAQPDGCLMVSGTDLVLRRFVASDSSTESSRARTLRRCHLGSAHGAANLIVAANAGTIFIDLEGITSSEQQELLALVSSLDNHNHDIRLIAGAPLTLFRDVELNEFRDKILLSIDLIRVVIPEH